MPTTLARIYGIVPHHIDVPERIVRSNIDSGQSRQVLDLGLQPSSYPNLYFAQQPPLYTLGIKALNLQGDYGD